MTATMAKEVAMIGNTPVGRETRRYFIRMETTAVEMAQALAVEGSVLLTPILGERKPLRVT